MQIGLQYAWSLWVRCHDIEGSVVSRAALFAVDVLDAFFPHACDLLVGTIEELVQR
jgi:hypothetical protein